MFVPTQWTVAAPHRLAGNVTACGIAIADVGQATDTGAATWAASVLPRAGKARRLSFLAGRACAAHLLLGLTGVAERVPRGAAGEPLWPPGLVGSITHTSQHAYAAVASVDRSAGLGIDSEPVVDEAACTSIEQLCATASERSRWLCGKDRLLAATALFSAKESFYKAVYPQVRRWIDFDEVEVTALDWPSGQLQLQCVRSSPLGRIVTGAVCRLQACDGVMHTSCVL